VPPPLSDGPAAAGILAYVMPAAMSMVKDREGDVRVTGCGWQSGRPCGLGSSPSPPPSALWRQRSPWCRQQIHDRHEQIYLGGCGR
jgi:hypothetical protein